MSMAVNAKWIVLAGLLLICAGCVTTATHATPEGFAEYTESDTYKAISPEGVVYRVRTEKNRPYAELAFWKEALKKRMMDAGYVFLRESTITAGEREGYLLELTAPLDQSDYGYMMAIFVNNEEIIIAEAAGEVLHLKERRQAILSAIEKLSL